MDNKIEIGLNKEIRFKCVKDTDDNNNCNICAFNNTSICSIIVCDAIRRKDNTDVHFELINK